MNLRASQIDLEVKIAPHTSNNKLHHNSPSLYIKKQKLAKQRLSGQM